jgi:hypothetical protein
MSSFIFEQGGTENAQDTTMYCLIGQNDDTDDNGYPVVTKPNSKSNILAYKTKKTNGDYKFMIRINSDRKVYNPLSIYGRDRSYNLLSNITRSSIDYKEVSSTAFDFYLRFLSTKNTAWLNKAEREI